jgi:hypothetical protein
MYQRILFSVSLVFFSLFHITGTYSEVPLPKAEEHLTVGRNSTPDYCEKIPIENGILSDPIKNQSIVTKMQGHPLSDGSILVHYPEKNNYYPGETIAIHAFFLTPNGNKKSVKNLLATLGEPNESFVTSIQSAPMEDAGGPFDNLGDNIYTALFSTSQLSKDPHNYQINIEYQDGRDTVRAANSVNFGSLHVFLVQKSFREKVSHDDYILSFKVKVSKKGSYHFQGSIYSLAGIPVGTARVTSELEVGEQTVELKWYRTLFCDEKLVGPLVLKYFSYANTTTMPGPGSPRFDDLYRTRKRNWKRLYCGK